MTKQEQVVEMKKEFPDMTTTELAEVVGCTNRTARYALEGMVTGEGKGSAAKILLFDIETSPMEAYIWSYWKNVIPPAMGHKGWALLSWSAKWLFDSEIMGEAVTPKAAHNRDDSEIVGGLFELMDEADILIGHNAKKFDIPKAKTRFILNGLPGLSPFRVVDTLAVARTQFAFPSNKLDDLNKELGVTQKMGHTGMQMWKDCVNGTKKESKAALKMMLEYNKVDVVALEELYLVLRPHVKSHPNVNLYRDMADGVTRCPNCGSAELNWNGKYYTPAGRFKAFKCMDCRAIGRSRFSDLSKGERKSLGLAIAN